MNSAPGPKFQSTVNAAVFLECLVFSLPQLSYVNVLVHCPSSHQTVHSLRAETVPVLLEALLLALGFTAFLAECHAHPHSSQPQVIHSRGGLG